MRRFHWLVALVAIDAAHAFAATRPHGVPGTRLATLRGSRITCMAVDEEDAAQREALRLPDPAAPATKKDPSDWEASAGEEQRDLIIPVLAIGSFALFALIIGSEYLTRGFCPPFLDTCINLFGSDDGGWS
jgi:hypothetical protein